MGVFSFSLKREWVLSKEWKKKRNCSIGTLKMTTGQCRFHTRCKQQPVMQPRLRFCFCLLPLSCFSGAGATGCINCTEGYFMEDGRCVQTCSISYYFDHSAENGYKSCKK